MAAVKLKKFLSIPSLFILSFTGFVYYLTLFFINEDWIGLTSFAGSVNALIFSILAFLCLQSFFVCVSTNPGQVPSNYVPDVESSSTSSHEYVKSSMHVRQCDKCRAYKPPRAHHCRVCRRCILRMDHHCLWINNCVGYWNYKSFVVLVFYATAASLYSTVMIISSARKRNWDFSERPSFKMLYTICGAMLVASSLTLGTLLGWHIYLITHNMTTIEYNEAIRATWLARKSGQCYRHPFDLGIYKNITSILGPNMLRWLCPTALSHLKDGTSFPTLRDS